MTPQEFTEKQEGQDHKRRSLPGASLHETMYFPSEESLSAASENT
jgi:hypothetical protein